VEGHDLFPRFRHRRSLALVVVLLTSIIPCAESLPTVVVTSPTDGSVFFARPVLISGNASGSDMWWNQSAPGDFNGTYAGTNATAGGELTLPNSSSLYDDFNDNSINTSKWTSSSSWGTWTVSETGGELKVTGSATSGPWDSYGRTQSPVCNYTDVSALIRVASYSGSGHGAWLEFYKDSQNYFYWGYTYDTNTGTNPAYLAWGRLSGGSGDWGKYNTSGSGYHRFRMVYDASQSKVDLYVDGIYIGQQSLSISGWKLSLYSSIRDSGSSLDARFDDVRLETSSAGNYTSRPYDTRMASPQLRLINWTAVTPGGTSILVYLRSSDSPDMSAPTSWYCATSGQADFSSVTFKRYLQYRVELHANNQLAAPVFQAISMKLFKPVTSVEASFDLVSWTVAAGTYNWSVNLNLPDGDRTVHIRVTDAVGDISMTTVRVVVDTVKACASLVLDGGDAYTTSPGVMATINWSGPVPVSSFQLANSADFDGAVWQCITQAAPWIVTAGDGIKTVYLRVRDRFGLVSEKAQDCIILDTVPPTGTVDIRTTGPVQTDPVVNLSLAAYDINGIDGMQLSNTGDFSSVDWIAFRQNVRWTLSPGIGSRTVYARFRDCAGLASATATDTVLVCGEGASDAPVAQMTIGDGKGYATSQNVSVSIGVSNGTASWMMISQDLGFLGASWRPFSPEFFWTLSSGDGQKILYARLASPKGAIFYCFGSVIVDTVPPSGNMSINDGAATTDDPRVTLQLGAADANGVVDMRIGETADLADAGWIPYRASMEWTLPPGEGARKLYASFRDAAGLTSPTVWASIKLLMPRPPPGPVPYGNISINGGARWTRSATVTLSLWLTDPALSRGARMTVSNLEDLSDAREMPFCPSIEWRLVGGDGNKTVYAAFHYMNETSPVVRASIVLDGTPPSLPLFDNIPASTTNSSLRLSGHVERGAALSLAGRQVEVSPAGRFDTLVVLKTGANSIAVRVEDEAGNNASTVLKVVRTEGGTEPPGPEPLPVDVSGGEGILWLLVAILIVVCACIGVGAILIRRRRSVTIGAGPETYMAMGPAPEPGVPGLYADHRPIPYDSYIAPPEGRLTVVHSINVEDLEEDELPRTYP
jgi:hypothetical protein